MASILDQLSRIQEERGWLPKAELQALGERMGVPLHRIESLSTFYTHFLREEPPASVVEVCRDVTCRLAGASEAAEELRRALGPEGVVLREVSCLGRCDAAPAGNVSAASSGQAGGRDQLVDLRDVAAVAAALRGSASADRPVRRWAADPYASEDEHFSALRDALADPTAPAALCRIIEEAGLRGMGGAGFPTGRKWSLVAAQPATPKHVICNADESEPGTFKDREILHDLPHLVIEGMALAALAVGAERGTVFIRHEYGPERLRVEQAIERARSCGALGSSVFGSDLAFDVDVFVSPGGYILGEETALLECMEDRRGEPRNKPPYPGEHGLRGMPTLINNVETFAHAAAIVRKGADWWRSLGRRGRAGHKFMAVSGDVAEPGVVLVPFGTTLRELLEACGGARGGGGISAVAPGGASSNFLGEEELDVELDFDSLQQAGSMLGSGAAIFVGEGRDLFEVGLDVTRFFRNESCGKCVPCRVGTEKAVKLAEQADDREELARSLQSLHRTLERTSICGLGQVALAPLLSVLARSAWVDGAETGGRDRG